MKVKVIKNCCYKNWMGLKGEEREITDEIYKVMPDCFLILSRDEFIPMNKQVKNVKKK